MMLTLPVKLIISTTTSDPLQRYYDELKICIDAIENLRMAASLALLLEQRATTNKITAGKNTHYQNEQCHH
jgi:hypothetical protein